MKLHIAGNATAMGTAAMSLATGMPVGIQQQPQQQPGLRRASSREAILQPSEAQKRKAPNIPWAEMKTDTEMALIIELLSFKA